MKFALTRRTALLAPIASLQAANAASAETNVVQEVIFKAARPYANPFMNVMLVVEFTDPSGARKTVPAVWAVDSAKHVSWTLPATDYQPWKRSELEPRTGFTEHRSIVVHPLPGAR